MSEWFGGYGATPLLLARLALGAVAAAIFGTLLFVTGCQPDSRSSASAQTAQPLPPAQDYGSEEPYRDAGEPFRDDEYLAGESYYAPRDGFQSARRGGGASCNEWCERNGVQQFFCGLFGGRDCGRFYRCPNYAGDRICKPPRPARGDDYPEFPPRLVRVAPNVATPLDQRAFCPASRADAAVFEQPDPVALNENCTCPGVQVEDPETGFLVPMRCLTGRQAANFHNRGSRYWLLRGDSKLAADERDAALEYWGYSIEWGRIFGAQASLMAQRRVQAHMLQCQTDPSGESLDRIALGGSVDPDHRDVISLEIRQKALKALGYYAGPTDGEYGPMTRDAVRGFQRELGYDETGTLSPYQTTLLICHAAQTARDPDLQNALGIMYSTGLGVSQNTDLALEWFDTAIQRDDPDAAFNLALIYGTGAVLGSYRLCGIVENPERADAYLREAASGGHDVAIRWREDRDLSGRGISPAERWRRISDALREAAEANAEGGGPDRSGEFYLDWLDRIQIAQLRSGCGGLEEEPPAPAGGYRPFGDWN